MKKRFLIFVFLLSEMYITGLHRDVIIITSPGDSCFDFFKHFKDRVKSRFRRRSNRVGVIQAAGVPAQTGHFGSTHIRHGDKKASLQELCMRQLYMLYGHGKEKDLIEKISKKVPTSTIITLSDKMLKEDLLHTSGPRIRLLAGLVELSSFHGPTLTQWVKEERDRDIPSLSVSPIATVRTPVRHGDRKATLQELCMRRFGNMSIKKNLIEKISQEVPISMAIPLADKMLKENLLDRTQRRELLVGLIASSSSHGPALAQMVKKEFKSDFVPGIRNQ